MDCKPLNYEAWREYDWSFQGESRIYRIDNPTVLYVGKTTHRVVDATGVVHCVPAVGEGGCVVRWKPRDPANPVQF
jgi:hypothetical protein